MNTSAQRRPTIGKKDIMPAPPKKQSTKKAMQTCKYAFVLKIKDQYDKEHPLYLRISVESKTSYLGMGISLPPKLWNQEKERIIEKNVEHQNMNVRIEKLKTVLSDKVTKMQVNGEIFSAESLKKYLKGDAESASSTLITDFLEEFILENEGGDKHKLCSATIANYRRFIKKLIEFNGGKNTLTFDDITCEFLTQYEAWLKKTIVRVKDSPNDNYTYTIWKALKSLFRAAIKKGITKNFPFDQYNNPEYVTPEKDYLTLKEVRDWEKFLNENEATLTPTERQAGWYFLLGCYSGLRISDQYRFDFEMNVIGNRLRLRPKKTEKYNQWVEMPLSAPLHRVIDKVKHLPLTIAENTFREKIKAIGFRSGIGVKKNITTHTGRHTFAVTICLEGGMTSSDAAELMGITEGVFIRNYRQVSQSRLDTAAHKAWARLD